MLHLPFRALQYFPALPLLHFIAFLYPNPSLFHILKLSYTFRICPFVIESSSWLLYCIPLPLQALNSSLAPLYFILRASLDSKPLPRWPFWVSTWRPTSLPFVFQSSPILSIWVFLLFWSRLDSSSFPILSFGILLDSLHLPFLPFQDLQDYPFFTLLDFGAPQAPHSPLFCPLKLSITLDSTT